MTTKQPVNSSFCHLTQIMSIDPWLYPFPKLLPFRYDLQLVFLIPFVKSYEYQVPQHDI